MSERRSGPGALAATFDRLRASGRRAFIPYVTAGHPSPDLTLGVLDLLVDEGADVIELGIPFSDPLADGPTIQAATWQALGRGVNVERVLAWTREFAAHNPTPVVLFSYLNPILQYGPERFLVEAERSGAAGLLITDLPVGEDSQIEAKLAGRRALDLVRLVAPTTPPDRQQLIVQSARGFIYYISRRGVTGESNRLRGELAEEVGALRRMTDLPIVVGFGISSSEHARLVASIADGVVMGSALVRTLAEGGLDAARQLVRTIRSAIDEATS